MVEVSASNWAQVCKSAGLYGTLAAEIARRRKSTGLDEARVAETVRGGGSVGKRGRPDARVD